MPLSMAASMRLVVFSKPTTQHRPGLPNANCWAANACNWGVRMPHAMTGSVSSTMAQVRSRTAWGMSSQRVLATNWHKRSR